MKLQELHEAINDLDVTKNYFAFGTLRNPEVLRRITGREHDMDTIAYLPGFKAVKVKGETFPALVPDENSRYVEGRLVTDLTDEDWKRIDYYENGLFTSKAMSVKIEDGKENAQVYAFHDPKRVEPLPDKKWSYSKWLKNEQPTWVKKVSNWMKDYKENK